MKETKPENLKFRELGLRFLRIVRTMELRNQRVWIGSFLVGLLALNMAAEKVKELAGEEASSKIGKFSFLDCFDMGTGSLGCAVKGGVKLSVYNIRNKHMERVRQQATEIALTEAVAQGLVASAAVKQAQQAGTKAAKLASRQAKRILGPIVSSSWDFFETIYYGGTMIEGLLRGTGTLFGTYVGGFLGEERLGRLGYLIGSQFGGWVGGNIGLMAYDVINGVVYFLQFVQSEEGVSAYIANEDSGLGDAYKIKETIYEGSSEDMEYSETIIDSAESSETIVGNPEPSDGWDLFRGD